MHMLSMYLQMKQIKLFHLSIVRTLAGRQMSVNFKSTMPITVSIAMDHSVSCKRPVNPLMMKRKKNLNQSSEVDLHSKLLLLKLKSGPRITKQLKISLMTKFQKIITLGILMGLTLQIL